jgi:glycosyltransferase involved in cell wall biosynthesis
MRALFRIAERYLEITLAEPGYTRLFSRSHPVFPNFPDTTNYPDAGGDPSGPAIYLGDITHERGADVAVAACSDIHVPLTMVGRAGHATESGLRQISGLGEDLVFTGPLSNRKALDLLTKASVGLCPLLDLPNYRESQPTKILEYLAMGVPVVASDLPGTRFLVEDLRAVVLAPAGDSQALADAISAARSPEFVREARAQAPIVRDRYRWPAEEIETFYESLVSTR